MFKGRRQMSTKSPNKKARLCFAAFPYAHNSCTTSTPATLHALPLGLCPDFKQNIGSSLVVLQRLRDATQYLLPLFGLDGACDVEAVRPGPSCGIGAARKTPLRKIPIAHGSVAWTPVAKRAPSPTSSSLRTPPRMPTRQTALSAPGNWSASSTPAQRPRWQQQISR